MSFRVTTNGLFRDYRAALISGRNKMYDTMNRVETTRNFTTYAEDPAAASKAFQLRRSYWRNQDYIDNSNYVLSKNQVAWSSAKNIVDGDENGNSLNGLDIALRGTSDTIGTGRQALGQDLMAKADAIVMALNVQYNGEFVFAGADGLNVPFSFDKSGNLLYRGLKVDTPQDSEEFAPLQKILDEKTYVDIGLGMQEDETGKILDSSAYNSCINGLEFLGYGVDEEGDPRNLVSLIREIGSIFVRSEAGTGDYTNQFDEDDAKRLIDKLEAAVDRVQQQHVKISANSNYLETNLTQLEETQFTLNTEIDAVEQIDPAMAIMEMMWAQYSYNAALRIGNDILSNSLFDYMR